MSQPSFLETCMRAYKLKSFSNAYHKTFELLSAESDDFLHRAYHLLYQVYCEEIELMDVDTDGTFIKEDPYDGHAAHYILRHKISGETAGVVRIVKPDDQNPNFSLPIQALCDHPILHQKMRALTLCEISHFCMAQRFRKRDKDGKFLSSYSPQDDVKTYGNESVSLIKRRIAYAPALLMRAAFEEALRSRIVDCVWMVEPRHLWSLNQIGFTYRTLGPAIDYLTGMQPIIFNVKHVLDNMKRAAPACWDLVSDSGRLHEIADELCQNDWYDALMDDDCWDEIYNKLNSGEEPRI